MDKIRWAVQAGDQVGDSEDDQPCGDHFIDKDLECHDGDAHRPTPGKNPYFQGDRKGPQDKSKTPDKGSSKNQPGHKRDRDEHTQQNRERMETLLDQGHTPESLGRDQVNHFADMMEDAYQRPLNDKDIHTLVDMVNQKMGENFSQDPSQKGIHDPTAPKGFKGPKGREMSRPDSYHKETTDGPETPGNRGGPEEGGLYDHYKNILKDRVKDSGGDDEQWLKEDDHLNQTPDAEEGGPSQEMKDEQDKWDEPDYAGETAPDADKGYEYQDRHVDEWDPGQSAEEVKPYQKKERRRQTQKDYKRKKDAKKKGAESSLASKLTWAFAPDDMAEARPCEPGEDPKIGKCNPNTSPEPRGMKPEGPAGKTDPGYRMHDKLKGPAQEGIGIQPGTDPSREGRMAQHVDFLTQDDGTNPQQTTNLMSNMMGGAKPVQQEDGSSLVGSPAGSPQEAKQKNDDYKDTLTKSGWENRSDMGGTSTWKKGKVAIVLKSSPKGNQMKVKGPSAPAAQPKKKGWFR